MTTLYLMRHAEAAPESSAGDAARELTPAGRSQVRQLVGWLSARVARPSLILHSPLVRTTQTAELVSTTWQGGPIPREAQPHFAPGARTTDFVSTALSSGSPCLLMVGHQPDIGHAICSLCGGGTVQISPGTLAIIDFSDRMERGGGRLSALFPSSLFH